MRSTIFALVLLSMVLTTPADARTRAHAIEESPYVNVWKDAAPEAFLPGAPRWIATSPDTEINPETEATPRESVSNDGLLPANSQVGRRHCALYIAAPDRLLTICRAEDMATIGLYDAASQRKLDGLSLGAKDGAQLVRLTSKARWDLRIQHDGDSSFYAELDGKLVRVATFGARYRYWDFSYSALTATDLFHLTPDRDERNGDPGDEPLGFIRPIDEDGDGFNERLELAMRSLVHANGKVALRNSPRVTRTLTWNAKTHTYED